MKSVITVKTIHQEILILILNWLIVYCILYLKYIFYYLSNPEYCNNDDSIYKVI